MAVAYDNSVAGAIGFGSTSLTAGPLTVSGANRAALIIIETNEATVPNSFSFGGVTAVSIGGATQTSTVTQQLFYVIAPATGSQSVTVTFPTAVTGAVTIVTFTGANQTLPVNNATLIASAFGTTRALTVTSTSGDLTYTAVATDGGADNFTSDQTKRQTVTSFGAVDTGPGTGTTTHTWTAAGAENIQVVGVNVRQPSNDVISTPGNGVELLTGQMTSCGLGIGMPDQL